MQFIILIFAEPSLWCNTTILSEFQTHAVDRAHSQLWYFHQRPTPPPNTKDFNRFRFSFAKPNHWQLPVYSQNRRSASHLGLIFGTRQLILIMYFYFFTRDNWSYVLSFIPSGFSFVHPIRLGFSGGTADVLLHRLLKRPANFLDSFNSACVYSFKCLNEAYAIVAAREWES